MVKLKEYLNSAVETRLIASLLCFFVVLLFSSCHKKAPIGHLQIHFATEVDGTPLQYDVLDYVNDAGNRYEVNEVRYFISRVTLTKSDGTQTTITDGNGIHYYDSDLAQTHNWLIDDDLPVGEYKTISFVFGLDGVQNKTGFFVNPPETNMAWPDPIGGGYHYMQINGKWLNTNEELTPFCLHTGIGQTYQEGAVTGFVQNYFTVSLPVSSVKIVESQTAEITLTMNVNNWFRDPNEYDLNEWGGAIMQNQVAQEALKANGHNVFSVYL